MPTYDYECTKCGHVFEAFQSMSDKLLTKCPECGGKVKRLIGAGAGLIFKGSGFYITDYRSKDYKERAKSDTGGGEGATPKRGKGTKGETTSETRSDAKSDATPAAPSGGTTPKAKEKAPKKK